MTKSLANLVGGKTARACDSCVKRRARWYCTADDAFLCNSCDGTVHSANPLARRHERVRLKSASTRKHRHASSSSPLSPTWHNGFTRKARTPRGVKKCHTMFFHDVVPEMSIEDKNVSYEVEEQLIFQVPVLNPMVEETEMEFQMMPLCFKSNNEEEDNAQSCLNDLFPTEKELAEFTSDVETLLGGGIDREVQTMEEVGLGGMFKIQKKEVAITEVSGLDEADDSFLFNISFDYEETHKTAFEKEDVEEDAMNKMSLGVNERRDRIEEHRKERVLMLRLDYESVISTWGGQSTPWTAREPLQQELVMLYSPTNSMGESGGKVHHHNHFHSLGLHMREAGQDKGRKARVSRYRKKRRTRLFSKKIRYEVRKLNAEKRPRMKGRFVKKSSVVAAH